MTPTTPGPDEVLDLAAVGIGPFNLALAALADDVDGLAFAAYDRRPAYDWHPGLMFDWATLQVSFLADLVSLIRPTSRWSFLNYLVEHDRMYPFYVAERFHVPRREYADYCAWAAARLPGCHFGTSVEEVRWDAGRDLWELTLRPTGGDGPEAAAGRRYARNLVLGVGTEPLLPPALAAAAGDRVFHSGDYLHRVDVLEAAGVRDVTVVGSGQSGAEVFLDLLRRQRQAGWAVTWLTRSWGFAPLDYSKLVLEYTTPAYMRYFNTLAPDVRDRLIASQWQLYKGIDSETIDLIHAELYDHLLDGDRPPVTLLPATAVTAAAPAADGGVSLATRHADTGHEETRVTGAVVAATGYAARRPECLEPVEKLIAWDERGRYDVTAEHRVRTVPEVAAGLFVQNAELHTHGAAAPDLGIGAYRSALILNAVAGRDVFRIPRRTAFQTFARG